MYGYMDGWMDGWVEGKMDIRVDTWWTHGWMKLDKFKLARRGSFLVQVSYDCVEAHLPQSSLRGPGKLS